MLRLVLAALITLFAASPTAWAQTILRNQALSAEAVDWLEASYDGVGVQEVSLQTSLGIRRVDLLVGLHAHEVKVGNHSLNPNIEAQIAKDRELLASGAVTRVTWHFFPNPDTGMRNVSDALVMALDAAGFEIVWGPDDWYSTPGPSHRAQVSSTAPAPSRWPAPSHPTHDSRSWGYGTLDSWQAPSTGSCCRVCTTGVACGNSCISAEYTCHAPPGCACDG